MALHCGAKHPFKNCGAEIVQILTLDQQPKYSRKVQHTFVLLIWGADFDDFGVRAQKVGKKGSIPSLFGAAAAGHRVFLGGRAPQNPPLSFFPSEKISALWCKLCAPQQAMDTPPAPGGAPTCDESMARTRRQQDCILL